MGTLALFVGLVIGAPLVVFSIFAWIIVKGEDHVKGSIGQ